MHPPRFPLPPSPRRRAQPIALAALLLSAAACAPEGDGAPDAEASGPAASAPEAPSAATGTITVGEERWTFTVSACDLGEVEGPDRQTLYGLGTTDDGTRFRVFVGRPMEGSHHSVSIQIGSASDIMEGRGTVWEARRSRLAGGDERWVGPKGLDTPQEPLVVIEGDRLSARDVFVNDDTDEQREGALEATCPPS